MVKKTYKSDKSLRLFGLVFAVGVVLVMTSVSAFAGELGGAVTRQAEVLGINQAAQELTVQFFADGSSNADTMTISIAEDAKVMYCTEPVRLDDLREGDSVTLTYREDLNGFIADRIDISSPTFAAPDAVAC